MILALRKLSYLLLAVLFVLAPFPRVHASCPAPGEPVYSPEDQTEMCEQWALLMVIGSKIGTSVSQIGMSFNFAGKIISGQSSNGLAACANLVSLDAALVGEHQVIGTPGFDGSQVIMGMGTFNGPSGSMPIQLIGLTTPGQGGETISKVIPTMLASSTDVEMAAALASPSSAAFEGLALAQIGGLLDPSNPRHAICISKIKDEALIAAAALAKAIAMCKAAALLAYVAMMVACGAIVTLLPWTIPFAMACAALAALAKKKLMAQCMLSVPVVTASAAIVYLTYNYKLCLLAP